MNEKEMKLNPLQPFETFQPHFHPEWVIDWGPLIRLGDEELREIIRVRFEFLAEKVRIDAKVMELQAKAFEKIAGIVKR